MAILHIVNRDTGVASCLATAAREDTLILIEDGVYAATVDRDWPAAVWALEPDVRARGLASRLAPGVKLASDADFVDLVVAHQPIVTWR